MALELTPEETASIRAFMADLWELYQDENGSQIVKELGL